MDRRIAYNLIAVLIVVLWCALLLAFGGCATTNMEHTTQAGDTTKCTSRTLWKNVELATVDCGVVKAAVGASVGSGNEVDLACALAPQLEGCGNR